jgi:hypothetical protein
VKNKIPKYMVATNMPIAIFIDRLDLSGGIEEVITGSCSQDQRLDLFLRIFP